MAFTAAYAIWSEAAENHLTLQLKSRRLPSKCKGRRQVPNFKTQTLAAKGTHRIGAGAATEWGLRLSKLIRKCQELEARLKSAFHITIERGTERFALAKALHVDIIYSGRKLVPGWGAQVTDEFPVLHQVQTWLHAARTLGKTR